MASKPELLIYQALRSLLARSLPKGRWMLQRIETSTGTGIPDIYFSFMNNQMWIETKTVDYKVSNEQLNWAATHWRAGGLTYIISRIKHTPTTRPSIPAACSNVPTHTNIYPTLLNLYKMPAIPVDNGIQSYDQLINSTVGETRFTHMKKGQETLIFLTFDDRMRECSTLGSYLRKFNPDVLEVDVWTNIIKGQS